MKSYPCPLDEEVTVIEVEKTDPEYAQCEEVFKTKGHAFTMIGSDVKAMIIDAEWLKESWVGEDHVRVVHAHELGHLHTQSDVELEADQAGFDLIAKHGPTSALNLYFMEMQARYC